MRTTTIAWIVAAGLLLGGAGLAAAESLNETATGSLADAKGSCKPYREAKDKDGYRACLKDALKDRLLQRHARHHRPPPFDVDNGSVTGKWVSFQVDDDAGAIRAFTSVGPYASAVIWDAITVADHDASASQGRAKGGAYVGVTPTSAFVAFNAPNAGLYIATPTGNVVTLDPADGVDTALVLDEDGNAKGATVTRDGHAAKLVLRGNGTIERLDDGTLIATLEEKSALGFAIDGYPRLTHKEAETAKKIFQQVYGEKRERGGERERPEREMDVEDEG